MMKEIVGFLKWQWNKFEFWPKCFVVSSSFIGASIVAPEPVNRWLFAVPMIVVFGFTTKWFVWDGVKASWQKYKEDRNSLLTTIKESDK